MTARKLTACALMTALLIAVQVALGFAAGVELVTVLFLVFCDTFGARCGSIVAVSFSLLRCILWGFYPNVVCLYLIYFTLFALLFGTLGKRKKPVAVWVCPLLLGILLFATGYFALNGVPVSILYRKKLAIMLWILFGILLALLLFYFVLIWLKRGKEGREVASLTALAAMCTVFFTLLDDVISPLINGYTFEAAIAYFYGGFLSMIPQTICTILSVGILFVPLRKIFDFAAKKR
ncbi:MAG: hypothetical protein J6D37_04615 [Clostridia bacterium]|nr:hypothetical protein [Clostridia bacterium]